MMSIGPAESACSNCGTALVGGFCHVCGQKRFVESDRRFGHLLHQFFASVTDVDGRAWRTVRALLFQPGLLTGEYFAGRRARWLSPVSLFLAVSVLYFFAPMRGGDLTLQFNQQVPGSIRSLALGPDETLTPAQIAASAQAHSAWTAPWIERRVARRDAALRAATKGAAGYSYRDYRLAYDAKANDVSKALVILHVPAAALALMLMFAWQRRYFAEHFVFALHDLAFWMFALVLVSQLINVIRLLPDALQPSDAVYDWLMRTVLPAYVVIALHRAYATSWPTAILAGFGLVAAIVIFNLYVYHAIQFIVTFALT
jgi:hypothetical protein